MKNVAEIDKAEFKDGDVVVFVNNSGVSSVTLIMEKLEGHHVCAYACGIPNETYIEIGDNCPLYGRTLRHATEEEKQKLFDALAKDGKKWDAENKKIVPLFQPFEKVICRDIEEEKWSVDLYSHYDSELEKTPHTCVGGRWAMCVPYEGNEKLVGTNDEWEGGE